MNEMDMRMSLSRSRSHQSAFSTSSRGRAVSVSTSDVDTHQNHATSWHQQRQQQQQQQQPRLQHGGRTGTAPRVLRFPDNSQSSSVHAPMSGSSHLRRRHSMTAYHGEVGGEEVSGSSIGESSRHVVIPTDVYATPGREPAEELRDEDDYGRPLQLEWPHWNRYDAYSPPTTRASIGGGSGVGLRARAVSRCGSSGGEASTRPASMSSVSNRGMPGSVPSSYASELVFSVKDTREDSEAEAGGPQSARKRLGERGGDSDDSEDRDVVDDPQDDVEGAVFELELY